MGRSVASCAISRLERIGLSSLRGCTCRARDISPRMPLRAAQTVSAARRRRRAVVGAGLEDLADLVDREAELVVGGEEVRPEPDPGVGTEVAEDLALGQLAVDGREVGDVDGDGPAAPLGRARAPHLEPGRVREVDQELRLAQRVRPDAIDADLLDQVVARGAGEVRRHVGRPGEEARGAGGEAHLLLEAERRLVRLPARERRLEPLGEVGPDVEPPVAGAAAEPLHRAADGEVDAERGHVERDDPGRLVAVEDHVRPDLVRAADDRLDVLDLPRLEEHVADRDEQRPLVDRVDDRASSSSQTTTSRSGCAW